MGTRANSNTSELGGKLLKILAESSPCTIEGLAKSFELQSLERHVFESLPACLQDLQTDGLLEVRGTQVLLTQTGAIAATLDRIAELKRATEDTLGADGGWVVNSESAATPRKDTPLYQRGAEQRPGAFSALTSLKERLARFESPATALPGRPTSKEARRPEAGGYADNIPRQMRAHVPVAVEVHRGLTPIVLRDIEVASAVSLRLIGPKGAFHIDAHGPETQWETKRHEFEELGSWTFTLTPLIRGKHTLLLAFSHKLIGPGGVVADSPITDRTLEIVVRANIRRLCKRAAIVGFALLAGFALGTYFDSIVRLFQ